jgi:hypothetical protein
MNKVQTLIYHYFNFTFSTKKRNKINNLLKDRHYPAPFIYGPEEISRYIIDFINPIHTPPSKKLRWKRQTKKKWCLLCGEYRIPGKVICEMCNKPFHWYCSKCSDVTFSNKCRPRSFPVSSSDSEFSD